MPDKSNPPMLAWRLARADGTSRHQRTYQEVGKTYTVPPDPALNRQNIAAGHWGFHGACLPTDTLCYAKNVFIERIRLSGDLDYGIGSTSGLVAASERTTLWRADAAHTLLEFAADAATRAVLAQPGFVEHPSHGSEQWLAEEAIGDVRNFLSGAAIPERIQTFGNAHIRSANYTAPFGEKMAMYSAYAALRACSRYYRGDMALLGDLDNGLRRASDAASCVSPEFGAWQAERDWQNETLHARLMKMAWPGYHESDERNAPPNTTSTWETVAPLLYASAKAGKETDNASSY